MSTQVSPSSGLTMELCRELVHLFAQPLPEDVQRHTERSLLNVIGTAIGASGNPGVGMIVDEGVARAGIPTVPVLGKVERLDILWAATANGFAAHVDDFDDTHLRTVIHPGAATMASVVSMGIHRSSSGEQILRAFALGCEAQLRIGVAMSPWHYNEGWHITGTCGVMGAAVSAGLLAGLDAAGLCTALGLAASQTLGLRESFGTMGKAFNPGKAAANGILAVLLAGRGFTASERVLEAPRGFFNVLSPDGLDISGVTAGLGTRWEALDNTFKPYPCGIVSHPAIDSALELSSSIDGRQISGVRVRCHPLVTELTGNPDPADGLEARFSTAHGVAVALIDDAAGLAQYADERVNAEDVRDLRSRITFDVDESFARDEASVSVEVGDTVLESHTEHARGSIDRPLTDEALQRKMAGLIEPVLPGSTQSVVDAVDALAGAPNLDALVAAATMPARGGSA